MPLKDGKEDTTEQSSTTGRNLYTTGTRVNLPPINIRDGDGDQQSESQDPQTPMNESEHDKLINNNVNDRNFVDLEGGGEQEEQTDISGGEEEPVDPDPVPGDEEYALDEDPVE